MIAGKEHAMPWSDATKISSAGLDSDLAQARQLTSTDLARAAQAVWQAYGRAPIPPANLDSRSGN